MKGCGKKKEWLHGDFKKSHAVGKAMSVQLAIPWFPGLEEREVEDLTLWSAPLDHPATLVERMEACLTTEERDRARRFVRLQDQERFIISRGLLRHTLAFLTGDDPQSLIFQYGSHGKPRLAGWDGEFNLSHSHNRVMIAASPSASIGVDVERVRSNMEVEKLTELVMSPAEKQDWWQLPEEARLTAFFRLWTRKEAFVKAVGEGLSRSLTSVTVGWHPIRFLLEEETGERWEVVSLEWLPGYEAAYCVKR